MSQISQATILEKFKEKTKKEIFCTRVGKIEKLTITANKIEANIVIQDNQSLPMLIDVPIKQDWNEMGGLQRPINVGDECLVFFNDVDYRKWYFSGERQDPEDNYSHDLIGAFAVCGLSNSLKAIQEYNNTRTRLFYEGSEISLDGKIDIKNTETDLKKILEKILEAIEEVPNLAILDGLGAPCTITDTITPLVATATAEITKLLK
jgi:hypothetical protein